VNATPTQMIVRRATTAPAACACSDPIPLERAERKGAAVVVCVRCGYRVPQRLQHPRR
jgi:Zn ribbon nucleic-acid-binding protein